MKKMQCEVCGSNEIKKVTDDIFECQSCGVQYSKGELQKLLVEITGKVKIEHSEDSENMVKRAKQFESSGDTEKAKEYYQKALDFNPDNKIASDALSKLAQDNCYIIEKNIERDEAVKKSLEYLYSCENVTPDIFANITDVTITEKYYPFVEMSADLSGQFAGVSCYKHEIPYTEYKNKQVYSNGRYHTEKEAVTKYRTEIERKPATGFFSAEACGTYSISKEFGEKTAKCAADKAGATEDFYSQLFLKAETKVSDIIRNIKNIKRLDIEKIVRDKDTSKYNNTEIEIDFKDKSWLERMGKQFIKEKVSSCQWSAKSNCPGDYSENVSYTLITEKTESRIIYIPFLLFEFKYKGKDYTVVSILNNDNFEIAAVYPADKETTENQINLEIATKKLNEGTIPGAIATLAGIVGGFLWLVGAFFSDSFTIVMYIGIAMLFLITLPCVLLAFYFNKRKKKKLDDMSQNVALQRQQVLNSLEVMYKCFMDNYSKTQNIIASSKELKNVSIVEYEFCDSISNFRELTLPSGNQLSKETKKNENQISSGNLMHFFAHFGIFPMFWWTGIFVLFFKNKAKKENGGVLSKDLKKYLKMGIIEFSLFITVFLIIIIVFLLDEYIV